MVNWQNVLKTELGKKVSFDPLNLQLYSTAACMYEVPPLAVVIPETPEDISKTLEICHEYNIPVLPRGAATSLSGGTVNKAVILDISKFFHKINAAGNASITVECGAVLDTIQAVLLPDSKKIGPDPSSGNICTIGGMLANNSAGPHSVLHGNISKHVNSISMILADGTPFTARNILLNEIETLPENEKRYYLKIKNILEKYKTEIESSRPNVTKNASGYMVWDILTETHLNLASLFTGSEGTLGIFTEANLKLVEKMPHRGVISLYFDDLVKMGLAVQEIRKLKASSIEFVDSSFLNLATAYRPEMKKYLPENVEYLLYVELEDQSIDILSQRFEKLTSVIKELNLGQAGDLAFKENEIIELFKVRKAATAIMHRIEGANKPLSFIEDAAVHPDVFPEFLKECKNILDKTTIDYVMFGHAGDGNLHIRPLLDLKNEEHIKEAQALMEEFSDLVIRLKGTLSGEHGDGRLRTPFLKRLYPKLISLFNDIKACFDPNGILNPGIIIPLDNQQWNEHSRYTPDMKFTATDSLLDSQKWLDEIQKCHGCGTCRSYCPVFQSSGDEAATGRAKANILRGFIKNDLDKNIWESQELLNLMDLCLNCGQCLTDCPTAVDIPGLVVAAKSKIHEYIPYTSEEKFLQNGKLLDELGSLFTPISNWTINNSFFRQALSKTIGIHPKRILPHFYKSPVADKVFQRRALESEKQVVLWSGCAANYNDPKGELQHSEQILEKLGYTVIHPEWRCCNIAKLSYGNLDNAHNDVLANMKTLLPYAKENIPVIFTSASCGYAFMDEYERFFPENEDIKTVADVCIDIHEFLGNIFSSGEYDSEFYPLDLSIVYHEPCHLKSQKNTYSPADLLLKIPKLDIRNINDSCCGMAGTFGMKKAKFESSLKIGDPLFKEIKTASPQLAVSGCSTCQLQIKQGTDINTIHPIILLNKSFRAK